MTGRDLITGSLRLIGAVAPGEGLDAAEAVDGLSALNSLIDSLSNESLLIYAVTREASITLVAGTSGYTLGTSGDLANRPMSIESALLRVTNQTPALELPIKMLSQSEWASINLKGIQSDYPLYAYEDGGYPLRTVNLYPVPSAAYELVLFTKRPLTQIATIDDVISLPPGYERMLRYNLAIDLAPEYGRPVSQEVDRTASESKASLKRTNYKPNYLRINDVPSDHKSSFNILTGDYE
jgi:hypothetical protein